MGTIFFCIEGVLAEPYGDTFSSYKPIPQGFMLYESLAVNQRLYLSSVETNKDYLHYWMNLHKIWDHKFSKILSGPTSRAQQLIWVRSIGAVDLVVTADVVWAQSLIAERQPTLVFCYPQSTRQPTLRRQWADISDELDRQILDKAHLEEILHSSDRFE